MGIKTFWKILEGHNIGEKGELRDLEGSSVAVDLSGWIVASLQVLSPNRRIRKPHLRDLFWKANQFIRNQIKVVFILDGTAPSLKASELKRRQQLRHKCTSSRTVNTDSSVGKSEADACSQSSRRFDTFVKECCELLDALGLPWIQSDGEAEATCAWLNHKGVVDGVVSQDGDSFLFGAKTVYRNFSCDESKESFEKYSSNDITEKLGFSRSHLVALALLVGCDYDIDGVKGIGKEQAAKLLQGWKTQDPLQRFQDWRENTNLEQLESYRSLKKPTHCGLCKHLGSSPKHTKEGCYICETTCGCVEGGLAPCTCEFHRKRGQYDKHALELKVRREAMRDDTFPSQQVIDAFLKPTGVQCDVPSLSWKPLNLVKLKALLCIHLGWNDDLFRSRIFPLLVHSVLQHQTEEIKHYKTPVPVQLVRQRIKSGQKFYEVNWTNLDVVFSCSGDEITELVPVERFCQKFPQLVTEFEQKQSAKKSGSKKRIKLAVQESPLQTTMDQFYKFSKAPVQRSLFQNPSEKATKDDELKPGVSADRDQLESGCSSPSETAISVLGGPKLKVKKKVSHSKRKLIELDSDSE